MHRPLSENIVSWVYVIEPQCFLAAFLTSDLCWHTGILNCWDARLHCSRGSAKEGIWNGMRLVYYIGIMFSIMGVNVEKLICVLNLTTSILLYSVFLQRWSLGAIMYEMLVGYPPFYADDPITTCRKVCFCSVHFATSCF